MFTRYVATKDLFQALIRAKRPLQPDESEEEGSVREADDERSVDTCRNVFHYEEAVERA